MMGAVTREELAKAIDASTRLTGTFTLRSGATTSHYFDKFQSTSDPALLDAVTDLLVGLIPPGTEVLAGLELGGVPLAAVLSLKTGLPAVYVRKAPKPYGTSNIAEGVTIANRTVVVIEDVVTTGGHPGLLPCSAPRGRSRPPRGCRDRPGRRREREPPGG